MQATDEELMRRAQRGEPEASHELVRRHSRGLFALAVSLVGSPADAEDVVQETLLGAFGRPAAFREQASVKTWLTRILVNQASKLRRSRGVRRAASLDDISEAGPGPPAGGGSTNPAAQVQQRADVMAMLDTLSDDHRQVIVLRELQGLSYDEMARVLGVPKGTIESRLFRARRELQTRFAGYLT